MDRRVIYECLRENKQRHALHAEKKFRGQQVTHLLAINYVGFVIVGMHTSFLPVELSESQRNSEGKRPMRKKNEEIAFFNIYTGND